MKPDLGFKESDWNRHTGSVKLKLEATTLTKVATYFVVCLAWLGVLPVWAYEAAARMVAKTYRTTIVVEPREE